MFIHSVSRVQVHARQFIQPVHISAYPSSPSSNNNFAYSPPQVTESLLHLTNPRASASHYKYHLQNTQNHNTETEGEEQQNKGNGKAKGATTNTTIAQHSQNIQTRRQQSTTQNQQAEEHRNNTRA